jgi:hypothetical protein
VCSCRARSAGHAANRKHPLDDIRQLPETLADGAVATAPEQVHHDGVQEGEHWGPDPVGVAMSVLTQLGVAGPVPLVLNAPSLPDQAQQDVWRGEHAGQKQVPPHVALSFPAERAGDHLHDPGAAGPVGLDVLRCLPGPQCPDHVAPVALLAIACLERGVPVQGSGWLIPNFVAAEPLTTT